jgi:hypothetical protein
MASRNEVSRFRRWFQKAVSDAGRAAGTPAGVNVDLHKAYCPTRNGTPDFSGGECRPLPEQGASGERG